MSEYGEREIKPIFVEDLFCFEDPTLIPDHYDEWPKVPSSLGKWALFGWNQTPNTTPFAVDVPTEEMAVLLACAKKQYLEAKIQLYGHTLDIYILDPLGGHTRYYKGRMLPRR